MEALPPEIADYLSRLSRALAPLPPAERNDLLGEISAHFADGLSAGVAPTALVSRMGDPEEVAQALVSERLKATDRRRSPRDFAALGGGAIARPFLIVSAAFIGLNALYLLRTYWNLLSDSRVGPSGAAMLLWLNLPAVAIITVPIGLLFAGATGLPALARAMGRPAFRKLAPRFCLAVLALGLVASGAGVWLLDHWVARANRGVVEFVSRELLHREPTAGTFSPQEQTRAELARTIALRQHEWNRQRDAGLGTAALEAGNEDILKLRTQAHLKIALPFLSLALAAIGCSLGLLLARIRSKTGGSVAVLALGGLTGMGTYALLGIGMAIGPALGMPLFGAWFPDLMLLVVAGLLAISGTRAEEASDVQA